MVRALQEITVGKMKNCVRGRLHFWYRPARLDLHGSSTVEKGINRYRFFFYLEYFIRVQSSEPLHAK
jgi:hypothetical protein